MTRVLKSIALLVFLFLSPLAQATETRLHVTSTQLAQDMSYLLVNYSEPIYGGDGLETAVDPDEYEYFIHPRDAVPNFRISSITMADGSPIQPGTQTVKLNLDFGEYDARRPFWLVVFSLGMEMVDAQLNRPDKGFYKVVEYAPPVLPLLGEDGNVEIHVSPQGSDQNLGSETQPVSNFDQVFELIREHINLSDVNDIKVIFRGGRYELSETIVLDSSLSPDRGKLIFTNYPGETPVFSGGRLLTDLSITEENGIWAIPVPALEEFRQLYTTGTHEKAIRAREPDEGFARVQSWDGTAKTLTVNNTALDFGTTAIQGAEMVISRKNVQNRLRIQSISQNASQTTITPKQTERDLVFGLGETGQGQAFYFENARAFLDQENEFYYHGTGNTIYYKPAPGESKEDFGIIIPQVETLFEFNQASNIIISGLKIMHSNWNGPSKNGFIQRQGGMYYGSNDEIDDQGRRIFQVEPAAVELQDTNGLVFHRNVIQYTGANGINFKEGTANTVLVGNVFHKIGDTAVFMGQEQNAAPDEGKANENEYIYNNLFHTMGVEYSGSAGIFATYPSHLVVENNEICYSDNLGINLGWLDYGTGNTALKDGLIRKNYIHHIGSKHDESAGLSLRNAHPNLKIFQNHFADIQKDASIPTGSTAGAKAIYLETDAAKGLVTENEFTRVDKGIHLNMNGGYNATRYNQTGRQAIIQAAGLTPAYSDIKNALSGTAIGTGNTVDVSIPALHTTSDIIIGASRRGEVFNYDGEDDTLDQEPRGIDSYVDGDTLGHVKVKAEGENQYIEINDNKAGYRVGQQIAIPFDHISGSRITFQTRIRVHEQSAIYVRFREGDRDFAKTGLSHVNRSVRIWDGTRRTWFTRYPGYNQWVTLKIVLDMDTHQYKCIVNGTRDSSFMIMDGNPDGLDAIIIAPENKRGTFSVDDLRVTVE